MKQNVSAVVRDLALSPASELGLEIWDVEYVRRGGSYYLVITIDKAEGVTIDDCEAFHRRMDTLLDEVDPIEGSYYLEISSPGVERELRLPEHYQKVCGETVSLRFFAPLSEEFGDICRAKELTGELLGFDDAGVRIAVGEHEYTIPQKLISKANTVFEF